MDIYSFTLGYHPIQVYLFCLLKLFQLTPLVSFGISPSLRAFAIDVVVAVIISPNLFEEMSFTSLVLETKIWC